MVALRVCLVVYFLVCLHQCSPVHSHTDSAAPDEETISQLARRYVDALARTDLEGCMALWDEKSPHYAEHKKVLQQVFSEYGVVDISDVKVRIITTGDGTPEQPMEVAITAQVTHSHTSLSDHGSKQASTMRRLLYFVRTERIWRIWHDEDGLRQLAIRMAKAGSKEQRNKLMTIYSEWINADLAHAFASLVASAREANAIEVAGALAEVGIEVSMTVGSKVSMAWCTFGLAQVRTRQQQYDQALTLFKQAEMIFRETGHKVGLGRTIGSIGEFYVSLGAYQDALKAFYSSLDVSREAGDKEAEAATLNGIANCYNYLGRYAEAEKAYAEALHISQQIGDHRKMLVVLNNMTTLKLNRGQYEEALRAYEEQLQIARKLGEKSITAAILVNLGKALIMLDGRETDALQVFQDARRIFKEVGDRKDEALALNNMAKVYQRLQRLGEAFSCGVESVTQARQWGHRSQEAFALMLLGEIHAGAGNYLDALSYYQQALEVYEQIGEKEQLAFAHIHIGNALHSLQRYDEALKAYEDALKAFEELGYSSGKAYAFTGMGNVYRALDRLDISLAHYEKALTIRKEMGAVTGEAALRLEIGDTYRLMGRYTDALKEIEIARRNAESVRWADGAATAWLLQGMVYQAQSQWDLATEAYKQAIEFIEQARIQIGDPSLAIGFFENYTHAYRNLAYCLLRLAKKADTVRTEYVHEALLVAEQGRARVLAELALGGRLDIESKLSPEEQVRLKQLHQNVTFASKRLYTLLTREPDATVLKELKTKADQARREYEDFRRALYARYAEMPVVSAEAAIIKMKDISRLLKDEKTAFVEYVVGEDFLIAFTIERPSVGSRDIRVSYSLTSVKQDELIRMVRSYRERLEKRALSLPEARQLYDLLIAPITKSLRSKRVIGIVPDEILWEVPFHALVDPQGKHVVQRWTVFYVPSLTVLNRLHQVKEYRQKEFKTRAQNASRKLFAMAYPAFGTARQIENPLRGRFSELPSTEREAKAIGAMFGEGAVIYMREDATEERAKRESARYRFLHFATHGLLDTASPMSSGLLLAQVPEQQEDGYLEAREIAELSLNAEMVVLSACETARGRIRAGEGIIGLCWALFLAGSPTNVLSQWKVDDESTQMLMTQFYRYLLPTRNRRIQPSKAEALRQAQLALLKDKRYQHPFYWAPFVLIGDWR